MNGQLFKIYGRRVDPMPDVVLWTVGGIGIRMILNLHDENLGHGDMQPAGSALLEHDVQLQSRTKESRESRNVRQSSARDYTGQVVREIEWPSNVGRARKAKQEWSS